MARLSTEGGSAATAAGGAVRERRVVRRRGLAVAAARTSGTAWGYGAMGEPRVSTPRLAASSRPV